MANGYNHPAIVTLENVSNNESIIYKAARLSYGVDVDLLADYNPEHASKLIKYLLVHKHLVPFEHIMFTFHITCPLFVARHLYTYRTWSRSEQSMRYTDVTNAEYYIPEAISLQDTFDYADAVDKAFEIYEKLRQNSIKKETARMVLPVCVYTQFIATINLRNLMHLFEQRLQKDVQYETHFTVQSMFDIVSKELPIWREHYGTDHLYLTR